MNNFLQMLKKSSTAQIIGPKNEILCTIDVAQKNGRAYVGGKPLEEHTFFRFEERMPHSVPRLCWMLGYTTFQMRFACACDSVRTWSIGKGMAFAVVVYRVPTIYTRVTNVWTTPYRKEDDVYTISQHNVETLLREAPIHARGHSYTAAFVAPGHERETGKYGCIFRYTVERRGSETHYDRLV